MAFTDPKTWSVGETLTAANFNTHIRDNLAATLHLLAYKSSDQTVTSSITVVDDTHLQFAVGVNEVWYIEQVIGYTDASAGTADLRVTWTWPSGSGSMFWIGPNTSNTLIQDGVITSGTETALGGEVNKRVQLITGIFEFGGTGGTFKFRWAQQVSNGSAVTVKKGSAMYGIKLA